MQTKRLIIFSVIIFVVVPLLILMGIILLNDRSYDIISILLAFAICIPFFVSFEKRKPRAREVILISIMTTISTVSRLIFSIIPGFKPVTAITIITGLSLGAEAGFVTGAMSAIVSNIYFGQGPWTPFQMLVWGLIGYVAGLVGNHKFSRTKLFLSVYGIISGVVFSLIMDIWVVLSLDNGFNMARYITIVATSLPTMVMYAVSNVVFLVLFSKSINKKLDRIKLKYGI